MNNDKNNVNTRSLDDLSGLDTKSLDVNNADSFFDDDKSEFTSDDFFASSSDNVKVKEESNEPNFSAASDFSDEDIFANLNLEDPNSLSTLDSNLDSEDALLLQENASNDMSTADNKDSNTDLKNTDISLENVKNDSKEQKGKKLRKPLTKKQKITIIVIASIIALLLICLIVYLLLPKKGEEPDPEPTETIVVDKGNYKYQDGTLVFLNDQKTEIGTYECENKEEDKCYMAYTSNDLDDANVTKNIYEDNTNVQIRSEIFHNRFVFVNDGDKDTMKLYDILENKTIGTYKKIKYYETLGTDYAILQNEEGKFGLVKITSNTIDTVINYTYDNLTSLEKKDNTLIAKKGSKYYLINLDDKTLTKAITRPIYDYDDAHLVVKNGNSYDLTDYENKDIFTGYNYISIINNTYVALVNDGSLYIRDYEKNKDRIQVVEGDIVEENLAINSKDYKMLKNNITTVINAGALVKHFGISKLFNDINVKGTENVVEFCKKENKRLIHISTISVSGNGEKEETVEETKENINSKKIFKESDLYIGQNISGIYTITKFEAEKIVLKAIKSGLNAQILRMGNITNRYSDGVFQQNVEENAFAKRLKSFIELGMFPKYLLDHAIELGPVDLCAEAVIKILEYDSNCNVLHIYNSKLLPIKLLVNTMKELGINIEAVDDETISRKLKEILNDNFKKEILSGIIHDIDSKKRLIYTSNIRVSYDFSEKYLEKIGFSWKNIDREYILKYMNYFKGIGFIEY